MKMKGNRKLSGLRNTVGKQIGLIFASLIVATIFLATSGYEPFAVVNGILQGLTTDIAGTVRWATPLILAGLAICVTYKAEVFNLGVDGQLYMGAAAGTAVALILPSSMNGVVAITIIFIASMIAGALFAMIPALLKVYLDTDEVVSTLLLNFIAVLFIEYLVAGPMRDKVAGTNLNASAMIPENMWLSHISFLEPSLANVGFYIALIVAVIIIFVFYKTTLGHEIKMVGANAELARYAGMKPKKTLLKVMGISGAIAGMIGAIEVTAIQHRLLAGFNPDFGFDGIVVSLLGGNNPIGVIFSGLFFGALKNGGINMERITDVPSAVTKIVMAIIIITVSAQFSFPKLRNKFLKPNPKGGK